MENKEQKATNDADAEIDVIQSSDSESNDDMDEDDMGDSEGEPTTCLFCSTIFPAIEQAIEHLDQEHKLNLQSLQQKFQMDQYSFLKLINYIRSERINVDELLATERILWSDEKYLKPLEYEPWLCFDYETLKTDVEGQQQQPPTVPELLQQLEEQAKLLQQAHEDMQRMREDYRTLLEKVHSNDMGAKAKTKPVQEQPKPIANGVVRNKDTWDNEYFNSYAHFGIHHEMLSDQIRTSSYRNALQQNRDFVKGKTVLDVGCGTGILSIFASQAGAARVVGIDNSEIVYTAMDIVRKNKVQNIELLKGRLEDTELPEPKYDIIISEWMGYFLLFEGMLDSIIYARETHLKPEGIILPNRCTLNILGYGNDQLYAQQIDFWTDVYGVDMTDLRKRSIEEPLIDIVEPEYMLTEPEEIANFNMMTVDMNYSNFTHEFHLKCTQTGKLSALVGYFDTLFELPERVVFGTSPTDLPTHWKQTVFFIDEPQFVQRGEIISGKITSRRHHGDVRALHIGITIFGKSFKYTVA
ncbi:protein arginine N-methyltransferase 1 [Scaptodrosophila lebanonensis]|uniref:type I protein arginine methyltransferase n=1 Tax=Drosophila lebanonensis TaxID=7225 RepID=A0A6J2T3D2_DROLE|nr:protein arginine N-methyltransferase 1 [Scaptodrosophila lebanonensis]